MTRDVSSLESRLLDREIPEDYLVECTAIVAAKNQEAETRVASAVIFRLDAEWFALPTNVFQEVAELSRIQKLPNRRSQVLNGIVNVRGELLLCASLDLLFELKRPATESNNRQLPQEGRLLVCNYKGDRIAFSVHELGGIHNYPLRDMRNVPATLARSTACTAGVLYWKERTVGCLDPELLFRVLNKCFQ